MTIFSVFKTKLIMRKMTENSRSLFTVYSLQKQAYCIKKAYSLILLNSADCLQYWSNR
jgi:hypothetical protein